MDVLRQAVKAGANMVITCEPTFYAAPIRQRRRPSRGAPAAPDAILSAKDEFIRKNDLVVWRFSDHWRLRKPDPFAQGLTDALGWSRSRSPATRRAVHPRHPLDALAAR